MTTEEYVAAQDKWLEDNNIRDGSKVKIFRIAENYEDGWGDRWIDEMDGCLGLIGTVHIDKSSLKNVIEVIFDDGDSWFFPYFVLDPTLKRGIITSTSDAIINILADWLSRSDDCPYGDDHDCEFRGSERCWDMRNQHPECWVNAAKEVLIRGYE